MKHILKVVFSPPIWFRWIFGVLSISVVCYVFVRKLYNTPIAFIAFFASAFGLYYLITVTIIPLVKGCKRLLLKNRLFVKYCEDEVFHFRVSLYSGVIFNILYAIFKFTTGIIYRSNWFIAIAVYYMILIGGKVVLVRQDIRIFRDKESSHEQAEWVAYCRTGWLLLLLNVGLSGITVQVVEQNKNYFYPGTIIFAIAAYSFYRIIIAVKRLFKDKGNRAPILAASRVIDVCMAVTGMFTLQTAMFASFSGGLDTRVPNIITGTAVAVIITAMAVVMIIRGRKKIKHITENG